PIYKMFPEDIMLYLFVFPDDLVYLHRFDQQCIERNLSPGGSADLLIVTWFLAQISQVNH
uniref:triphosphoribosyl-dephospho-CoA synthase n=1 Tax=Salmonella enterica TaxID=28901 RepID=UPI0015918FF3